MKHFTKYTLHKIDQDRQGPQKTYKVSEIEQPAYYRIRSVVVGRLDRLTYTVPGLKQVWRFGEVHLDKIAYAAHERSCNNDCMTGRVWRGRHDETGSIETYCGWMPLGARYDCWIYDITNARKTTLNTYTQDMPS